MPRYNKFDLPAPTVDHHSSVSLKNREGKEFIFNQKNYYENKDLFFKDKSFNRSDEVWKAIRHLHNFLSVAGGDKSVTLIYDLRKNLEEAKGNLKDNREPVRAQDTIDYCEDLIARGFLYVIIDGQNRETNNRKWYEGDFKNTTVGGFTSFNGYVDKKRRIRVDSKKKIIGKKNRQVYYIHPNAVNIRKEKWKKLLAEHGNVRKIAKKYDNREGKTYLYEEPAPEDFVTSYDNQLIATHIVTAAYYCQVPELYDRYNNSEKNKPVELRNAKQGPLATYKKALMWNGDGSNYPTKIIKEMTSYVNDFVVDDIDPRNAYYNDMISDGKETRMDCYLLAEEEFQFLDNHNLLDSAADDEYKDLYDRYAYREPTWLEQHKGLVKFRARCFTAYDHKQAKFKLKRKTALDYFIFGYDLQNPNDMFEEMNYSVLNLIPKPIFDKMTDVEKDKFKIKPIEVLNYEKLSQWMCDDVLLDEYDKVRTDKQRWDTETAYFNRLGTNKYWRLRRWLFRRRFVESIQELQENKIIRITDNRRVISDLDFRKLARQNDMRDSSGRKIKSFSDLFKIYAKSHQLAYSDGVSGGGVTVSKTTDIDTRKENLKQGTKPKVKINGINNENQLSDTQNLFFSFKNKKK